MVVGVVVVLYLVVENDSAPTVAGHPPKGDGVSPHVVRLQGGGRVWKFCWLL